MIEKDYQHKGLRVVVLALPMGHRCGYVGVPKGSRFHGLGYDELSERHSIDVHGGLTYAGGKDSYPAENPEGLWFFGFDCAHYGDGKNFSIMDAKTRELYEKYPEIYSQRGEQARSTEYVDRECRSLAEQLLELGEIK